MIIHGITCVKENFQTTSCVFVGFFGEATN